MSVAKIGKYHQLPKLAMSPAAKIGTSCQTWQISPVAKIGNVTSCQNWHQLPNLANITSCQNWQMSSLPKLEVLSVAKFGKFYRQLTCQNWILNTSAYIWLNFLYRAKVHSNDYPPWCELANEVYLCYAFLKVISATMSVVCCRDLPSLMAPLHITVV